MAVQINVAANQAALISSIQAGVQAYNQRFANNNQINLGINARAFSQPLGRITGDVKDFEAALAASNARVIAFGASTAVLGGVIRSFKELASVTIDVEKNLADINRVFGLTTSQLQKFSTDLFNVSKQTASSFDDASKAALEFSRQGLKAEETLQRTKDALTLTRLAGIGTANAVDALTSTVNGFAATGITTTQILNKLVAVEQDYAVGAGDLAEALSRTGQAAQEAGVSLDQLNALVTAAQQSTARGGAVIGNALKTIFTRLQRTETLDQLEAFNIAVRDVQGNILPAVTILQNFAGAYKNLADAQKAQLSEQVAGVYQVNILKAVVNDLNNAQGVYAGALQRGASATNEAEVATAKLNRTLDALLSQTATSAQQLANNIGKVTFEPLARYGTEQLKSLVESMNEILEGEGIGSTFANGLLKGIRNILAGPGAIAAFFTLFKLIQNSFSFLTQALPQIAGITTETQNRKNIEQSILQIMQQQGPISQALAGTMGNQAAQAQLLLQLARQQTAEYQQQSALAKQLATQLSGQGVKVAGARGLQVTRAGGYVPPATRMAEMVGAQAGGYSPGRVVSSPVGGVMNTAEDVKYIPGFAQPFINPPANSKAGRAHRQNAINRTGVDPYMAAKGFIPNFVDKKQQVLFNTELGRSFEKKVGNDIGIPPSRTGAIDFKIVPSIPSDPKKEYNQNFYSSDTFADAYSGSGHDSATNIGKVIRHLKLNYQNIIKNPFSDDYFIDSTGLIILDPNFTEIVGKGVDKQEATAISKVSSLSPDSKSAFLNGLSTKEQKKALQKRIFLQFAKDKVNVDLGNSQGFIPNFAMPLSTARIPWFKKYSSKYKNTASDIDLFKMGDFPTYGRGLDHEFAKNGNPSMLSYLHEDFVRSAINIALGSKKVIRPAEVGFKDKPISEISNENDFDLLYRLADGSYSMMELKQDFKNVSGSITGFMNKKLANLAKENPELAKKVSSMIAVSNRPKFVDPTGRNAAGNLSDFEMAISAIVKDKYSNVDPTISAKLTKVTDGLLRRYEAKKNTNSRGFIPNFAYKQAVMGLEESMSGNKAIFDTKPFPHIRNSSQPTFSSAIADHGSLGNALSDSMRGQKAAGLMSKGFIPNFADFDIRGTPLQRSASVGGGAVSYNKINKAVNDYIKSIDLTTTNNKQISDALTKLLPQFNLNQQSFNEVRRAAIEYAKAERSAAQQMAANTSQIKSRFEKFLETLSKSSTTLAIAGPLIAGQLEQIAYGNKDRTELTSGERIGKSVLSSGLTAISTGASIGAAFGPWGSAIGAAAGAAVGLAQSLGAASLSADEYAKIADENKSKTQQNISAAQSYIDTLKTLQSATDPEIIKKASNSLAENFNNIKDVELQKIFRETGTDVKKLTDNLSSYETKRLKMQKDAEEDARAAQAGEAKTAKDLAKLGYSSTETIKGQYLTPDYVFLEAKKSTDEQIMSDYKETFKDLSSLSDDSFKEFQKLILKEKAAEYFSQTNVTEFLKGKGLEQGLAERLSERFDLLENDSNKVGEYLINNMLRLFRESKKKIVSETKDKELSDKLTNDFRKFKKELTDRLSDNLIAATDAVKKFEFETSMVNLVSNKLKEINDSIFSSVSNNLTELGGILVKSSQLQYGQQFQSNQLSLLRQQTLESTRLKNLESRATYLQQSKESIFSTGGVTRSPETQQKITTFLSTSLNNTRQDFERFASTLGLSQEAAENLAKTLETNQKAFRDRLRDSNNELQLKNKEYDLTELSNKINYETGLQQLELEKEKLKITYAQRDATLQLKKDTDAFKISSNQALELQKIQIGSEFRYLGLGKTQTFAAQQSDQKLIFDQEQKIAERQALLDARRSIIEIAAQEANTNAQEANTDAILQLVDIIAQQQLEPYLKDISGTKVGSPEYAAALGRFSEKATQVSNITSANASLRKAYSERRNVLSYKSLSDFGVTDKMSIQEAIAQLESSKTGKDKSTINAIDNTIQDLNNASNNIGSNATIYAAKVAQAKADFEQSSGFVNNMKIGFQELPKKSDELVDQLGRNLPAMFGDGLVDGIKAAIRESNNLGEALMGIASKFLDEISTTLMRSAIYGMLGSIGVPNLPIGGKQRGGIIRAQSGMYISGTGSGDKYPALLENGEYVLNRKAVMAMGGPSELDKLNFSMAPRFAAGGSFSNQFEDLASMEANMTTAGLEESKLYNELRDVKRQEAEQDRQKRRARKQQMAGIIGSLAGAAVSLGLAKGIEKYGQRLNKFGNVTKNVTNEELAQNMNLAQKGGHIGTRLSDTIPGYVSGGLIDNPVVKRYAIGGASAGIGFGGSVSGNSSTVNNNTNASNSFNFNTTVQRDGKIEVGANTTSYAQQDVQLSQSLNSRVYEVVLDTIRKEKRFGGSLAGVRNT